MFVFAVRLGKLLVNVVLVFMAADDRFIKHLEQDSKWFQQQLGQYGSISGELVTRFAYEEYKAPIALGHSIMVCPLVIRDATTNGAGGATSIGGRTWRSRRRADRHPWSSLRQRG